PENSSRRTQFIKRLVDFGANKSVNISLVYYPPYHSKYNPVERVWGVLEKHWNGQILDSVEKVLGLCRTMSWNGNSPVVKLIAGIYEKGITLTKKAMDKLETFLDRIPGIEKWALDISCYEEY
ncbi:MAG: transposase, partial [Bacteroidetes bacterium]|nr:transposase [Bacteroidota bacterium]